MSWLLGGPKKYPSPYKKRVVSAPQAFESNGFRKDILDFLKIGDECITLSACDLQKLISFLLTVQIIFSNVFTIWHTFWAEFTIFRMYQRFDQLFSKSYICLSDVRSESDGFRKDILQFSKIGDARITLSACDLQKLISCLSTVKIMFLKVCTIWHVCQLVSI